jgi:hypothetical protein
MYASRERHSPSNFLLRLRFMCKLFDVSSLAIFFHTPENVSISELALFQDPIRLWAHLLSFTPSPAFFIAILSVCHNWFHSLISSFFFVSRPMAFRKSPGPLTHPVANLVSDSFVRLEEESTTERGYWP